MIHTQVTFFKCPQINPNHLIVFLNSYRFLRWWALCSRNGNFPALCGCEGILGRKSTDDIVSFHVPFMFLSCSFHVALISFHVALISFHVPFMFLSLCIHVLSLSVAIISNIQVGIRPNARSFVIVLLVFWRSLQGPSSGVHAHVPSGELT